MAYIASRVSPTTRLITAFLRTQVEARSAIDISDAVGCSYWTVRTICRELVASGGAIVTMRGKSPNYTLAVQ